MTDTIDYFFSIGSPWAYLGLEPFRDLAKAYGKTIRPVPATIISDNGAISLRNRPEPRRLYWQLDLQRWSTLRNRPLWIQNRPALGDPTPGSFSIIAAELDGQDWLALSLALHKALWADGRDIGQPDVRRAIANEAGFDGDGLIVRESDADVQARWSENLARATEEGIFGSPTYVYEGQPYWGQDSLPLLERHIAGRPLVARPGLDTAGIRARAIVEPEWLADRLDSPEIVVLDASYTLPGVSPVAEKLYATGHVPGAHYFDIAKAADLSSDLPNTLPDAETFNTHARAFGISRNSHVIVYDNQGLVSAARVWWLLKSFGHEHVSLLNGGLKQWKALGLPLSQDAVPEGRGDFDGKLDTGAWRNADDITANLETGAAQVLDARPAARFRGDTPETRPGLRAGHIPGSLNVPVGSFSNPETGRILGNADIAALFERAGIDPDRPVIASCGTGVTACAIVFGLHLIGRDDAAVYDGSWTEWGRDGGGPIATGA